MDIMDSFRQEKLKVTLSTYKKYEKVKMLLVFLKKVF
jgi:hypothetical protein